MSQGRFEHLLRELAEEVAERVAAKVVERMTTHAVYTTASRGPGIPGKSRAWCLRNIRTMPGARKVGRDWVITAEAYEAWLSERDDARFAPAPAANDVDRLVKDSLRAAGFRRAR